MRVSGFDRFGIIFAFPCFIRVWRRDNCYRFPTGFWLEGRPCGQAKKMVSGADPSNASALGLSAAAALAVWFGIVLWPWGFLPLFYIAWRLHLNKIMVTSVFLLCLLPAVPALCMRIGAIFFKLMLVRIWHGLSDRT